MLAGDVPVGHEIGVGRDRDVTRDSKSSGEAPRRGQARAGGKLARSYGVLYVSDELPMQRAGGPSIQTQWQVQVYGNPLRRHHFPSSGYHYGPISGLVEHPLIPVVYRWDTALS